MKSLIPTKITLTTHSIQRSLERCPPHLITTQYQTNPNKYCTQLEQLAKQALKSCITLDYLYDLSHKNPEKLKEYNLSQEVLSLILTRTGYLKSFSKDLYYWYKNCVFVFYKKYNSKNVILKTIIDLETIKKGNIKVDIPCKNRVYFKHKRYV